jgi:hypothetical protein
MTNQPAPGPNDNGNLATRLDNWLDQRTGMDSLLHEALDEPISGGAKWAYVFGSGLLFLFVSQIITHRRKSDELFAGPHQRHLHHHDSSRQRARGARRSGRSAKGVSEGGSLRDIGHHAGMSDVSVARRIIHSPLDGTAVRAFRPGAVDSVARLDLYRIRPGRNRYHAGDRQAETRRFRGIG